MFSDYLRHSVRLSALMHQRVLYILTHDSIGVGEDGPTHQPIEHIASFRAMPGVSVFRPADGKETAAAYLYGLGHNGPTLMALSLIHISTERASNPFNGPSVISTP